MTTTEAPNEPLLSSTCYCSRSVVSIPVSWVSAGITESCGTGCGPGCEMVEDDSFDLPETEFDGPDTALEGYEGILVIAIGKGVCHCGCEGPVRSPKARFDLGHDMRLRSDLTKAYKAGHTVVVKDLDAGYHLAEQDVLVYAAQYSTAKLDWPAVISGQVSAHGSKVAAAA